jgi:hypothetical protein
VSPIDHAYVGASTNVTTTGGNVTVRAGHNTGKASRGAKSNAFAGSGGALLGLAGAIAKSNSSASVEADTGAGSTINADQTVTVAADATQTATAKGAGLGGGFVGIGLSGAEADIGGSAQAHVEGGVGADNLNVNATNHNNADSSSAALAGGLIAVAVNYSHADLASTASARIGGGAHVSTTYDVNVLASAANVGHAQGLGVTVGGIAIGGMETSVSVGKGNAVDEVVASLDNGAHIDSARYVTLKAVNGNTLTVEGQSAGGGAITVTGSDAGTTSDETAAVKIGTNVVVNAISFSVQAINSQTQDSSSDSVSVGLASGGGAVAHNTATGDARVSIGDGSVITARTIVISAANNFDKSHYGTNLDTATVAVGSVSVLVSETHAGTDAQTMDASVDIGAATLRSNGSNADPGTIKIDANTSVNAIDKVQTQA